MRKRSNDATPDAGTAEGLEVLLKTEVFRAYDQGIEHAGVLAAIDNVRRLVERRVRFELPDWDTSCTALDRKALKRGLMVRLVDPPGADDSDDEEDA